MTRGHLKMHQVIEDGLGSGKIVILWIAATFLVTWASEAQGFSEGRCAQADARAGKQSAIAVGNVDFGGMTPVHDVKRVLACRFDDAGKSSEDAGQCEQAAESKAVKLQESLQGQQERAEQLEQDLAAVRRDIEAHTALATKVNDESKQERERADGLERDLAAAQHNVETQAALATKAKEEASEQKQAAESAAAELHKSLQQEREQTERLERDLAATRREAEMQKALAGKSSEEAGQCKQAAESNAVKLQASLQEQQERAEQLQQDLAAARGDIEAQTALATKASDEASRLKQVAEVGSAELKRSLQHEHDRAEALAQDLSTARTEIYAYEAQARTASDQAADHKQAAESGAAELNKSLQQERERADVLERDLAAAQHNVETQAALATKAAAEAARLKKVSDEGSAELLRSLQQERDRTSQLERELASERKTKDAAAVGTVGQLIQDKQVGSDTTKLVAADQATVAKVRDVTRPNPEDVAESARLVARASVLLGQGDIGSARIVLERAAEMGSARASFTLAETYDPLILPKWGAYGTRSDAATARDLYAKAEVGGIKEAKVRLDALARNAPSRAGGSTQSSLKGVGQ
jgi:hypothetical protein